MKLEKQSESTKSSHALAAANIRKELKHNFPGQKFSVRSSSFAGGDSVRVSWVDGPTVDEVEAITAKYQYGHFNGMEDIYEYNGDHNGDFGSAKYVQSSRTVSDEHIIAACEEYGVEYEVKENTYSGTEYVHILNYDDERRVYRALNKSFYTAPVKGAAKGDTATPAKEKPADDAINATTETTGYKATSNRRECVCEAVAISESGDVANLCSELENELQEHFYVLHLNGASQLIEKQLVSLGTLNQSLVHPREVFRQAIINSAAGIIVVHNHPSGALEPSAEDKLVTKRLKECGVLIGIELLDHIIISKNGHTSLREMGVI